MSAVYLPCIILPAPLLAAQSLQVPQYLLLRVVFLLMQPKRPSSVQKEKKLAAALAACPAELNLQESSEEFSGPTSASSAPGAAEEEIRELGAASQRC